MTENGSLTVRGTLPDDGDAGAKASGSRSPEAALPPPPPPPPLSRQALREQRSQATKQLRSTTFRSVVRWLSGQHRAWYWFFGVVGVLFMGALFALWFAGAMVRAVRVEADPGPQQTSVVYKEGIPNPLKRVKLTPEAATILGARDTDRDGVVDELDNVKSSDALVTILQATDLCGWFVTVDNNFKPVLSQTVTPGAVVLAKCAEPIAPATTAVPATTAAPTTVAPTTTAAPAK